jgi:hypothetical protein
MPKRRSFLKQRKTKLSKKKHSKRRRSKMNYTKKCSSRVRNSKRRTSKRKHTRKRAKQYRGGGHDEFAEMKRSPSMELPPVPEVMVRPSVFCPECDNERPGRIEPADFVCDQCGDAIASITRHNDMAWWPSRGPGPRQLPWPSREVRNEEADRRGEADWKTIDAFRASELPSGSKQTLAEAIRKEKLVSDDQRARGIVYTSKRRAPEGNWKPYVPRNYDEAGDPLTARGKVLGQGLSLLSAANAPPSTTALKRARKAKAKQAAEQAAEYWRPSRRRRAGGTL